MGREEDPDVHPVLGRGSQGFRDRFGSHKVGIRDPYPGSGPRSQELGFPVYTGPPRFPLDDPDRDPADGLDLLRPTPRVSGHRRTHVFPDAFKCTGAPCRRRTSNLQTRFPPGRVLSVSGPLLPNAEPADEGNGAIDTYHLPVVPLENAEGVSEGRRVEGPHLDAGFPERSPIPTPGGPGTHPIVEDPYLDAIQSLSHQGITKDSSNPVVSNNVVLEMDVASSTVDGFDPGIEGVGAVELKANSVPVHAGSPGDSSQCPFRNLVSKTGGWTGVGNRLRSTHDP